MYSLYYIIRIFYKFLVTMKVGEFELIYPLEYFIILPFEKNRRRKGENGMDYK